MGKVGIMRASPLATVQDEGRFGQRRYGIPQSGAMDATGMRIANQMVGNDLNAPVVEYALGGMELNVLEDTVIGVFGARLSVNRSISKDNVVAAKKGDLITLSAPKLVYGYLSIGGKLQVDEVFGSVSTYLPGRFGGFKGRNLQKEDVLQTESNGNPQQVASIPTPNDLIRCLRGPEWDSLIKRSSAFRFTIEPSSNRIGIRLKGEPLKAGISEIRSSAVIPGTIQLPPSGQPIVLMNDCQTTGGYPRIGKVLDHELGKLAQLRAGIEVQLVFD